MGEWKRLVFPGFSVLVPQNWVDITQFVTHPEKPYTIARCNDGVGAFQVSVGLYTGGKRPNFGLASLHAMLDRYAELNHLVSLSRTEHKDGMLIAGDKYKSEDNLLAVWYVTDSDNIAFVTYVCEWALQSQTDEVSISDEIVKSFTFVPYVGHESAVP